MKWRETIDSLESSARGTFDINRFKTQTANPVQKDFTSKKEELGWKFREDGGVGSNCTGTISLIYFVALQSFEGLQLPGEEW